MEVRADAASGVPATGSGATLAPIQPFVFSQSIAPMLGIEMPSVGSGAYSEMTISTALSAAAKAKGAEQDSTAAVLTATTASPRSIRARLTLNLEDIAAIGQANFESALRENANAALSDGLDTQAIIASVLPSVNFPAAIANAVALTYSYREEYRPRHSASELSDGAAPSVAGAVLRSGAAEALRFYRVPGV